MRCQLTYLTQPFEVTVGSPTYTYDCINLSTKAHNAVLVQLETRNKTRKMASKLRGKPCKRCGHIACHCKDFRGAGCGDGAGPKNSRGSYDLKDSPSLKVVKRLCNRGLVSLQFLKSFKEKMGATKAVINSKPQRAIDDEDYWLAIRNMFAYDEEDANDAIPMNTANFAPTFHNVQLLMNEYNLELNKNISIQNRLSDLGVVIDAARVLIATQLGVTPQEIALMRNGTEANNNVNNGRILKPTDEVVIWEQNHGTNNQAWFIRQAQRPFVIKTVPSEFNGASTDDEIVAEFMKLVNAKTKFVTFSHLSNVSGRLLPAEKICKAVHAQYPNCHVHVDGAMTWGCMSVNLVQIDCDSYSASAHKWFLGPKETGIFYMKTSRIQNFVPNTFGYDLKIILPEELYNDARRFETLGQRADPSLMCLLNTAEIMGEIGFQAIEDRVRYMGTLLYNGLQAFPDFPMTTPANESQRIGVIIAGVNEDWGTALVEDLYENHRIAVWSTGGFRASPTICTTTVHVQTLLDAIAEYRESNPQPSPGAKV